MPKVTKTRIGQVLVREMAPGKWRGSWVDPTSKRHVRRRLPATSYREAVEQAKVINQSLAAGKGFGGRLRGASSGHSVRDAIIEAVRSTGAAERTKADYLYRGNGFLRFLEASVMASWNLAVASSMVFWVMLDSGPSGGGRCLGGMSEGARYVILDISIRCSRTLVKTLIGALGAIRRE